VRSILDLQFALSAAMRNQQNLIVAAIFGTLVFLMTGVNFIGSWAQEHTTSTVTTCEVHHSHLFYFDVMLSDGTRVMLTSQDLPHRRKCLEHGATMEKKRWQFGWIINGSHVAPDRFSVVMSGTLCAVSLCLAIVAIAILLRLRPL
jgi:hypothetical protein